MRKLLIYLRNYKKESLLGPVFKLLEAAFELLVPLIIARIIDQGIAHGDVPYIMHMCLILVGLGIAGLASSLTAQYYAAKAAAGFGKELRHALFDHIQGLSYAEIDQLGTSTLITRMTSDMNQVQSGVNMTLRLLLRSPFIVFGSMIMAFTIDTKAALVFAAAILLLSLVVFAIMAWCIPLYKKVQARLDQVLLLTRENLAGVRVIRAFCLEQEEVKKFRSANQDLTRVQKYVGRISALMNPITYIIINAAVIWLIWTGALQVSAGLLTQGAVVALYNYMSQILAELIKLANLIITINKSIACGNRIQDVFQITSSLRSVSHWSDENRERLDSGSAESQPAMEFRQVKLAYSQTGDCALQDMSFAVGHGETVGIIGGTGSGKSSLVHLIPRFYDVTEGQVLVDGLDVKDYPLEELRHKIGLVPQKAVLFKGTIRDNIKWGKKDATDQEILQALTTAQAKGVVEDKGGLDYLIQQDGKNLSGGQKQRLTIARALVRQPEILILDDSASALDFATDAALRKALSTLSPRPTVLLVSQRTSSIQHCDKILVLDDGQIAGIGTHHHLLETCQVYQEIYQSQFKKEGSSHEAI